MRNRSLDVSGQDCLDGYGCYDQVNRSDAKRFGIAPGQYCDRDDPWCGAPDNSELAREQWANCCDDEVLNFETEFAPLALPPCIPNLYAREVLPKSVSHKFVAVKLTDIGGVLSSQSSKLRKWRGRYGIPIRSIVLVHQESLDPQQDKIARLIKNETIFQLLPGIGSNLIFCAPGYSVYDDGSMCQLKQIANLRTSLLHAAAANRAGFQAIPTLGWSKHRSRDLEFISEWLKRQGTKVSTLAVNAQTGTHSTQLCHELADGMFKIEQLAGKPYHWVVFGGRKRIETIVQVIPRNRITQVCRPKDFQVPRVANDGSMSVQFGLNLRCGDSS